MGRIIVTRNCPLRCQMCTFWRKSRPDPSLEIIKHWIKELVDFGVEDIGIGGGEPFIRKDLLEIVEEIKSYGVTCGITTSGWLVGKVPFPPVDQCEISIDGATPETHDKIRGRKGSWERAVNTIKIAKEHCRIGQLNFVLQADNYHELVDFCLLAKQLGLGVSVIPVSLKLAAQPSVSKDLVKLDTNLLKHVIGEAMKVGNLLNNREFLRIFLSKLDNGNTQQPCMAPSDIILIFANGDVYPCGNFDTPVGNLSEGKSLEDIYQDYKTLRARVWSGSYEGCSSCIYPDIVTRATLRSRTIRLAQRSLKRSALGRF
ncbi:radical SAM/SPASM domain-containing protein [Chloroflexota bacterium]